MLNDHGYSKENNYVQYSIQHRYKFYLPKIVTYLSNEKCSIRRPGNIHVQSMASLIVFENIFFIQGTNYNPNWVRWLDSKKGGGGGEKDKKRHQDPEEQNLMDQAMGSVPPKKVSDGPSYGVCAPQKGNLIYLWCALMGCTLVPSMKSVEWCFCLINFINVEEV